MARPSTSTVQTTLQARNSGDGGVAEAIFTGGMPQASLVFMCALWAVALFSLGTYVFLTKERLFALEL